MEIILSTNCSSFTGTISRKHGYYIRCTKGGRFFSQRSPGHNAPSDGHWRFIVSCAEIAKCGLIFSDIRVSRAEVMAALKEARIWKPRECFKLDYYDARQLINLKITFSL